MRLVALPVGGSVSPTKSVGQEKDDRPLRPGQVEPPHKRPKPWIVVQRLQQRIGFNAQELPPPLPICLFEPRKGQIVVPKTGVDVGEVHWRYESLARLALHLLQQLSCVL